MTARFFSHSSTPDGRLGILTANNGSDDVAAF